MIGTFLSAGKYCSKYWSLHIGRAQSFHNVRGTMQSESVKGQCEAQTLKRRLPLRHGAPAHSTTQKHSGVYLSASSKILI